MNSLIGEPCESRRSSCSTRESDQRTLLYCLQVLLPTITTLCHQFQVGSAPGEDSSKRHWYHSMWLCYNALMSICAGMCIEHIDKNLRLLVQLILRMCEPYQRKHMYSVHFVQVPMTYVSHLLIIFTKLLVPCVQLWLKFALSWTTGPTVTSKWPEIFRNLYECVDKHTKLFIVRWGCHLLPVFDAVVLKKPCNYKNKFAEVSLSCSVDMDWWQN